MPNQGKANYRKKQTTTEADLSWYEQAKEAATQVYETTKAGLLETYSDLGTWAEEGVEWAEESVEQVSDAVSDAVFGAPVKEGGYYPAQGEVSPEAVERFTKSEYEGGLDSDSPWLSEENQKSTLRPVAFSNEATNTECRAIEDLTGEDYPGCARTANLLAAENYGSNWSMEDSGDDSWFKMEHMQARGGKVIFDAVKDAGYPKLGDFFTIEDENTPYNHKVIDPLLRVNDFVTFDRLGSSYDSDPSAFNPNYINDGSEHTGKIVGFNTEGRSIVDHYLLDGEIRREILGEGLNAEHYNVRGITRSAQMLGVPEEYLKNRWDMEKQKKDFNAAWKEVEASSIPISAQPEATKDFDEAYGKKKGIWGRALGVTPDEMDDYYKTVISIGAQESNLGNRMVADSLQDWVGEFKYTYKQNNRRRVVQAKEFLYEKTSKEEAMQNKKYNAENNLLPPVPYLNKVKIAITEIEQQNPGAFDDIEESEFEKLVAEYLAENVEKRYGKRETAYTPDYSPSRGVFQIKNTSATVKEFERKSGNTKYRGTQYREGTIEDQVLNAIGTLMDNEKTVKSIYPNMPPKDIKNLAIQVYNARGKGTSEELIRFFYFGEGNPAAKVSKFKYLQTVNGYKEEFYPSKTE